MDHLIAGLLLVSFAFSIGLLGGIFFSVKGKQHLQNRVDELEPTNIIMMDLIRALKERNNILVEEKELYHHDIANNFLLLSLDEAKTIFNEINESDHPLIHPNESYKTLDKIAAFILDKEKIARAKIYDYTKPKNLWVKQVKKVWRDFRGTRVELDCGHSIEGGSFNFHHINLGDELGCPQCIAMGVQNGVKN